MPTGMGEGGSPTLVGREMPLHVSLVCSPDVYPHTRPWAGKLCAPLRFLRVSTRLARQVVIKRCEKGQA